MPKHATPFLLFQGQAEEALTFYASVFAGSEIVEISRYGAEGPGAEGSVARARFRLAGCELACTDSTVEHGFAFSPAISILVGCEDAAELDAAYSKLAEGGQVFMPPDNYGFSARFAWVSDRFGMSWQLNVK